MVFDSDLGIGAFVTVSEEDREIVRRARMENLVVPVAVQDAILQVVRAHPEWEALEPQDQSLEILEELSIEMSPPIPSRLTVDVVMAAWRAGHLV
ncbi:hypothetical protein [Plantactinospora sp. BB1]|uniref:hypothetical protein n=1 Tax=Plantactinospora sp. BB1 TaxID=2071627 RepID=UPI000D1686A6|nr:hypothetical protein [Plantactinospora sp. BB1]AVT39638.1 hypothetical protein C6W10_27955 [Plantactinospora sp. BB1]